jgi:transposase-like protein
MNLTKRQMWEQHVADYRSSGKSAKAWCEARQVKIHTLRYWISRFNSESKTNLQSKTEAPTQWIQIEACKPEQKIAETAVVITIGSASIKVTPGFDPELLKEVVRALSSC